MTPTIFNRSNYNSSIQARLSIFPTSAFIGVLTEITIETLLALTLTVSDESGRISLILTFLVIRAQHTRFLNLSFAIVSGEV